jgi:hypothetical protein
MWGKQGGVLFSSVFDQRGGFSFVFYSGVFLLAAGRIFGKHREREFMEQCLFLLRHQKSYGNELRQHNDFSND